MKCLGDKKKLHPTSKKKGKKEMGGLPPAGPARTRKKEEKRTCGKARKGINGQVDRKNTPREAYPSTRKGTLRRHTAPWSSWTQSGEGEWPRKKGIPSEATRGKTPRKAGATPTKERKKKVRTQKKSRTSEKKIPCYKKKWEATWDTAHRTENHVTRARKAGRVNFTTLGYERGVIREKKKRLWNDREENKKKWKKQAFERFITENVGRSGQYAGKTE